MGFKKKKKNTTYVPQTTIISGQVSRVFLYNNDMLKAYLLQN